MTPEISELVRDLLARASDPRTAYSADKQLHRKAAEALQRCSERTEEASHGFVEAGFDTCSRCGERKDHPHHASALEIDDAAERAEAYLSEAMELLDGHLGDNLISKIKRVLDLAELGRKHLEETKNNLVAMEAQLQRTQDAVQLLIDYIGDGCPDGTYTYCMTEAKAALKNMQAIRASVSGASTGEKP